MATNVSAPLPDLTLEEQSILSIDTGQNLATITKVVIHVSQEIPELERALVQVQPMFPYGPPA